MNKAGKFPLLTPKQEIQLSRQVRRYLELVRADKILTKEEERDVRVGLRARDRLISCNLRLVVFVAAKYAGRLKSGCMDIMDLVQEGTLGLHRASELYDGSKGYKFSTYCYWWIRQAITRGIDNKERLIRVPQHALAKTYKLIKEQKKFSHENLRMPTATELAEITEVPLDEMLMLFQRNIRHGSLDAVAVEGGSTLLDLITDTDQADTDADEAVLMERTQFLLMAVETLDPDSRDVLIRHYGLNGKDPQTLAAIGRADGRSRERIRQRVDCAKNLLRIKIRQLETLHDVSIVN